jgi:hypothetical protein
MSSGASAPGGRMRSLGWRVLVRVVIVTSAAVVVLPSALAVPATGDSTLRAFWHFDEQFGDSVHDQTGRSNAVVHGAFAVPGFSGYARLFDGFYDYIHVPTSPSLNLGYSSFEISACFKLEYPGTGALLRKGLYPKPGYGIRFVAGRVVGIVGGTTTVAIMSDTTYVDHAWHSVRFQRDRLAGRLRLYVDNIPATAPVADDYAFPLDNDDPLEIGRWVNSGGTDFLSGILDEIRIVSVDSATLMLGVQSLRQAGKPGSFTLSQNYPNPFNPTTVVSWQLPVVSNVKLVICDLLGREVATLMDEAKQPGTYSLTWNASGLSSGVYFCRISAGSFVETHKMILMK